MYVGFKVLDHVTRFDTNAQLADGTMAVGVVVAGMFVDIAAGVFYDRRLYDIWDDIPDRRQRLAFAFASYNGGRSRTLRAQDRCPSECAQWTNVQAYVPEETRNYVVKIMRLMAADL